MINMACLFLGGFVLLDVCHLMIVYGDDDDDDVPG